MNPHLLTFQKLLSLVTQAGLEFPVQLRMTLNFWSSCLHLPSVGSQVYVTCLVYAVLGIKARASHMLGRHSANWDVNSVHRCVYTEACSLNVTQEKTIIPSPFPSQVIIYNMYILKRKSILFSVKMWFNSKFILLKNLSDRWNYCWICVQGGTTSLFLAFLPNVMK